MTGTVDSYMETVLCFISGTRHACHNRIEGVLRYASERGWHVQVIERAFHEVNVARQLDFWRPIGVIAESGGVAGKIDERVFGDVPVVYLDADRSNCHSGHYVGSDPVAISRVAADHLLGLGLMNYGFVSYNQMIFWSDERRDAFVGEINRAGKGCFVFSPGRELKPHVWQKKLKDWLCTLSRPCGLFVANDYVGEDVINICTLQGIDVPGEMVIVGVDNDEVVCENLPITLTSVEPDFVQGGYLAMETLGRIVDGERIKSSFRQFGVSRLVVRQSTRRITFDRRSVVKALEFIRKTACNGISVSDVVSFMGEPRRTAEMHFRESVGRSIHDEIDEVRFARVFELLHNPNRSLSSIPDFCGFSSGAALRKAFSLRTGMSMSDWRRENVPRMH
jgi:LacI family transcriptional regulator